MGCHTWFSRPITDEEFRKMKEYAPREIYQLTGNSKENVESGLYDKNLYDLLMKSYIENIPCVYGNIGGNLDMEKEILIYKFHLLVKFEVIINYL